MLHPAVRNPRARGARPLLHLRGAPAPTRSPPPSTASSTGWAPRSRDRASRSPSSCASSSRPAASVANRRCSAPSRSSTSALLAALINGAASHALDFDDTHTTMSGHPSVPVIPAALALGRGARRVRRSGCWPRSWPASRSSAAWARSSTPVTTPPASMPPERSAPSAPPRHARICSVSTASASSTRSASPAPRPPGSSRASAPWRSRFTPAKRRTTGCSSALLAQGGFTGNPRIVESRQGFAETLHGSITPEAALERIDRYRDRFLVRDTLFKYHAACYLTHSAIDATRRLRESSGVRPEAIDSIVVEVPASSLDVCNIQTPVNRARRASSRCGRRWRSGSSAPTPRSSTPSPTSGCAAPSWSRCGTA